jgi:hypothetical protein
VTIIMRRSLTISRLVRAIPLPSINPSANISQISHLCTNLTTCFTHLRKFNHGYVEYAASTCAVNNFKDGAVSLVVTRWAATEDAAELDRSCGSLVEGIKPVLTCYELQTPPFLSHLPNTSSFLV